MKLKPRDIKKYNKLSKKKPIMVRVGSKWYTWYEGDPEHGVFLTTQSGRDVEFDWKQIDDIQEGVEKLTKSKLKEMIKEELTLINELEYTPYDLLDIADQAEALGKVLKKFSHGVSRDLNSQENRIVGKALKDYNTFFGSLKKVYKAIG